MIGSLLRSFPRLDWVRFFSRICDRQVVNGVLSRKASLAPRIHTKEVRVGTGTIVLTSTVGNERFFDNQVSKPIRHPFQQQRGPRVAARPPLYIRVHTRLPAPVGSRPASGGFMRESQAQEAAASVRRSHRGSRFLLLRVPTSPLPVYLFCFISYLARIRDARSSS